MWSDIDYMANYSDFTYNTNEFAGLGDWVREIQAKNLSYIPIVDAGVAQKDYAPYNDGVSQGIFINASNGEPFTGKVWPNDAVYPDFLNPATQAYWSKNLQEFHDQVPFNGLWLDMNEASNFCNGVCYKDQEAEMPVRDKLQYTPSGRNLETKSISLDAMHYGDVTELDAHSLFGTMEVQASHEFFKGNNNRTMIIERSSYAGMGKFGSRWLGDNFS
jgi:alpha-glucosidase (family GH31 glycosyl hydrolase)